MGRIFVVGSINQDNVLLVDRRPRVGETVMGATLVTRCGGKGANQAVAAVEMGASVVFLGRIGADAAGAAQHHDLVRRGVDVTLVTTVPDAPTGAAFITVTPDGENTVVLALGANDRLRESDVDEVAGHIGQCSLLVAQLEIPLAVVARAFALCGDDVHVLLNVAPWCAIPPSVLQRVDTLVANEDEAGSLVGTTIRTVADAQTAARSLLGRGPRAVVVTLGAGGAVVATAERCTHLGAPTASVVDSTGSGDVFVGTLAALLADGQPVEQAAAVAVDRATASVAYVGARRPVAAGADD
jgi:ribokinase